MSPAEMLEMLKMAEEGATNQTKHTYAAAPRVAFNDIWKKQKTKKRLIKIKRNTRTPWLTVKRSQRESVKYKENKL